MKHVALAGLFALTACTAEGNGDDMMNPPGTGTPLVTPAGDPVGPVTTVEIGPEGGHAASPDGRLAIDVPAGAVAQTTTFTIQPTTTAVPGAIGPGWQLGPEGQTFGVPVTLTFAYGDAVGATDPELLIVAYQAPDGGWRPVAITDTDPVTGTVSVQSNHFSLWSLSTGPSIDPMSATVPTAGTQPLTFQYCWTEPRECRYEPENDHIDDGCRLVCAHDWSFEIEWTVNGTVGGTLDDGLIDRVPGSQLAMFTAPVRAPEPDTVQVSATCPTGYCTPHGTEIAFARIKIEERPWYVGHVNITTETVNPAGTWSGSTAATVTFAFDPVDQLYHPREGMLHASLAIDSAGCSTRIGYDGALGHGDGMLAVIGTVYVGAGLTPGAILTGTVTCADTSGPATVPTNLGWWVNESPSALFPIQPDATLAESLTYTRPDGTVVTTDWLFTPVDPGEPE
jgi:hypothetical protein